MRVAVVALSDGRGRELLLPLRRPGVEPVFVPAVDAAADLKALGLDVALIEFTPAGRETLDGVLGDADLLESLPVVAVFGPEDLLAYENGPVADDFLLWPAPPDELLTRLRLVVRRRRKDDAEHVLRFGELAIDTANYRVSVAGQHITLTFKEYELLRFLATNRDRVFSREQLLSRVWGYDYYGGARTVDVHIRRLRSKIEDGQRTFIETVRNVGYRFREEG